MIRSRVFLVSALLWMLSSASVVRAAEICYSADQPAPAPVPSNTTTFTCPGLGVVTVGDVAAQGYLIVSLRGVVGAAFNLERQQLVIRRDPRIFASGFETP